MHLGGFDTVSISIYILCFLPVLAGPVENIKPEMHFLEPVFGLFVPGYCSGTLWWLHGRRPTPYIDIKKNALVVTNNYTLMK